MASESETIIGLYERHAPLFDRERGRDLMERAWLDRFLALLPSRARILDLGCGSAEPIARYFIEHGYEVTGVDASPSLIGICKERFPEHEWIVGDMRTLDLERRFDGVLAWNSVCHLNYDDQRGMFPIFAKHAKPTAPLTFTSGPSRGEAIGTLAGEPLYHGSLDAAEYRILLKENGFDVVSHVVEDPECGHHTIWLAEARSINRINA